MSGGSRRAERKEEQERFGRVSPLEWRCVTVATALLVGGALVFVGLEIYGGRIRAVWRGESDLYGQWQFQLPYDSDRADVAALDLYTIHRELLPRWVVAAARRERSPRWEREAFGDLESAIRSEPNLTWIAGQIRQIIINDEVLIEAERLQYLSWLWSSYLDRHGQPYWIQGGVGVHPGRPSFFYVIAYETRSDFTVEVDGEPQRVRLVARIDRMNIRELHLGSVSRHEDGAVLIADRIQDFAIDAIWPILALPSDAGIGANGLPEREDEQWNLEELLFAYEVAEEMRGGVSEEDFELLENTASSRAALAAVTDSIAERRWCSGFSLRRLPLEGLDDQQLTSLAWLAIRSEGHWCPRIKLEEAELLVKHTQALEAESGGHRERFARAIGAVVAWFSGTVTVHEGRHVADEVAGGAGELDCRECGSSPVASEVSAYLASFAWGPAPATAVYQACRAVRREQNPHAAAMEAIQQRLGHLCQEGVPKDLASRAQRVEREMLGRSERMEIPEGLPEAVVLREERPIRRGPATVERDASAAEPRLAADL